MEAHETRRTLVKPSIPTPPHLQEFRLSVFDNIPPAVHVSLMLHYHAGGGVPEKIHRLEVSLSETLTHFYHLAGRYGEAGDAINCNDQGVEFVEAKVNGKLDQHLLDGGAKYSEMLLALPGCPPITAGNSLPLVAIQVNVFECGGLVVAVQINHLTGDMFSMCTFINAWATTCREGTLRVVPPEFGLARLAPPKDPNNLFEFAIEDVASKSLVHKRFLFRNEGLSRLRDELTTPLASSDKATNFKRHPSKTELLTALICKVVVSVDRVKYGRARPMVVAHSVNLRGRTELPVHKEVFGNFYMDVASAPLITSNDVSDSEKLFHNLVQSVGDTLRNAIVECGRVKNCRELAQMAETSVKELSEIHTKGETNLVMLSSWRGFPLYDADYGWGRPTLVSTTKTLVGNFFLLMDAESEDGIEAWVTLEDDDMNYFEHHPDILKYACQQASDENQIAAENGVLSK